MLTDMLFLICPLKIMMWLSLVSPKKKILSLYRQAMRKYIWDLMELHHLKQSSRS